MYEVPCKLCEDLHTIMIFLTCTVIHECASSAAQNNRVSAKCILQNSVSLLAIDLLGPPLGDFTDS